MYVGSYDAPVRDLGSYSLRLQELFLLGFQSVGLAIRWDEHPRDLADGEREAVASLVHEHDLEIRFHPDLADVHRLAVLRHEKLLTCAARELEPVVDWALGLGTASVCCDSIRADLEQTVAVFRLLIDMTRGTELRLGVENSQRGVINSPQRLNEAVERVGDERMGVLLDVGHVNTTITQGWIDCGSPAEFVAGLRVPIWDTHFHTNAGLSDDHLPVHDRSGTLDVAQVIGALHERAYAGPLNLECTRKARARTLRDMEADVLADREYLERLIRETRG